MDPVTCPYCDSPVAYTLYEAHIASHETCQNDEEFAKLLAAQEEQTLNEAAALQLVQNDVANRDKFESKSPLSALVTPPEQVAHIAHASRAAKEGGAGGAPGAGGGQRVVPTARDLVPQFLAHVDRSHGSAAWEGGEVSHVVLFDIDNCGGEFEQVADAAVQYPDILVYVVGGPGLPNVSNVKLPILAEMHQRKRLHIIPMTKKGRNAADFVLSFYGGVLHERLPLHIPFVIVSKDRGLQQLVEHLGLLGRPAQLIWADLVKHLSLKPTPPPQTTTTSSAPFPAASSSTTEPTTQSTNAPNSDPNSNSNPNLNVNPDPNAKTPNTSLAPDFESAPVFTVEQATWFAVSGLSKVEPEQRPKTRPKLENAISGIVKRIPGRRDHLAIPLIIEDMQRQNFIFLDGTKVTYLF